MPKRPLLLLLGATSNVAFAAGTLLLGFARHNPSLDYDTLVFTDGELLEHDERLLRQLGAETRVYSPPPGEYRESALAAFTALSMSRLEALLLLEQYERVLWLDVDVAVQGPVDDLLSHGPFAMALNDPWYYPGRETALAGINTDGPVPGIDPDEPCYCAGVALFTDRLPDPAALYSFCMSWAAANAPKLLYLDQPILNMLFQSLRQQDPGLVSSFPYERFNCHPRNPEAPYATLVHAYGPFKMWSDALMRFCFPEWCRDYRQWENMGGSVWRGDVANAQFMEKGGYRALLELSELLENAGQSLEHLQRELAREKTLREKYEALLNRLRE